MKITNEIREFNEKCLIDALEEEFYYCEIKLLHHFNDTRIRIDFEDDDFHIKYEHIISLDEDPIIFKKIIKCIIHDIKRRLKCHICNKLYDKYSNDLNYYKELIS